MDNGHLGQLDMVGKDKGADAVEALTMGTSKNHIFSLMTFVTIPCFSETHPYVVITGAVACSMRPELLLMSETYTKAQGK